MDSLYLILYNLFVQNLWIIEEFVYKKLIKKNYRKKEIIYLQFQKNTIKNVLNVVGLQKKPLTWKVLINLIK